VVSLPIIDMSLGRDEVRRAILDAGKEIGFFQVRPPPPIKLPVVIL
jgi:2'-deoxymugineic-acid 2'-dioxygenase/mugineic-acid 3-dioxygenase